jgi:hypothetical protein
MEMEIEIEMKGTYEGDGECGVCCEVEGEEEQKGGKGRYKYYLGEVGECWG